MRFEVVTSEVAPHTIRYFVRDTHTGQFVVYSYSNPPTYETPMLPRSEWGNYYAARGFAQKLHAKQYGACYH